MRKIGICAILNSHIKNIVILFSVFFKVEYIAVILNFIVLE